MSIHFFCPSGHRLKATDSKVGQEIRCPKCQKRAIVPEAELSEQESEEKQSPLETDDDLEISKQEQEKPSETDNSPKSPLEKDDDLEISKQEQEKPSETDNSPKSPLETDDELEISESARKVWEKVIVSPPPPPVELDVETKPSGPKPSIQTERPTQPIGPDRLESPNRRKQPPSEGPKLMPSDTYQIDSGNLQTVHWLAAFLTLVMFFSCLPVLSHWNLETAPGWARIVWLLAIVEGFFILWMLTAPDWATVRVLMWVFACGAIIYGSATALVLIAPLESALPFGFAAVRKGSPQWCGSVFLATMLAAYLCRRTATRWRRSFDLQTAIQSKPSNRIP